MKTKFFLTSLLFCLGISASHAQKERYSCSALKNKPKTLKSNTLTVAQIAQTERYDVHFYSLDLNMTETSTYLSGTVEIHGTAREDLDSVWFELFSSMNIQGLRLNGSPVAFVRDQTAVKVPVNLLADDSFIIAIDYEGTPPTASTNPLGGAGMTNDVSPSWGNQITWSLSESFSAFEWFPCKQSLNDKADSSYVSITVPSNCMAGSNGTLEQVLDLGNGFTTYKWRNHYPIDYYLISVAVAQYVDYTTYAHPAGMTDSIKIQNFIYNNPGTLPFFQADLDETADFIEYFSDIFGLYPFASEKYGHCMAPLSGGMEHQTMTTIGFFEKTITAHELAHQWWGDHVTCNSWSDIWLNEGFASYAEYLMLEHLYPGEEQTDMNDRHSNIKSEPDGSIWVMDSLNAGRIFDSRLSYDKGSAFIHTLRFMINNDNQFFQGLRAYQSNHAYSTASASDFQLEMEAVSGLDLSAAFEQWYYGEGFPTYSAKWNLVGNDLHLLISQSVSMTSVTPLFTNPVELRFQRAGFSDTIMRVDIASPLATYIIPNMNTITNLASIDPKNDIINNVGSIQHDLNLNLLSTVPQTEIPGLLSIYPNPAKEILEIELNDHESYKLSIFGPDGKLVEQKEITESCKLNLESYQSGLYLFQFTSENSSQIIRKIVKR